MSLVVTIVLTQISIGRVEPHDDYCYVSVMSEHGTRSRTDEVYEAALVWDSHAGVYPDPRTDLAGLENWRQAGVSFVSLNIAYDIPSWETAFPVLGAYRRYIDSNPDRYLIVEKSEDIRRAKSDGRLAVGFDLEGMCALNETSTWLASCTAWEFVRHCSHTT